MFCALVLFIAIKSLHVVIVVVTDMLVDIVVHSKYPHSAYTDLTKERLLFPTDVSCPGFRTMSVKYGHMLETRWYNRHQLLRRKWNPLALENCGGISSPGGIHAGQFMGK